MLALRHRLLAPALLAASLAILPHLACSSSPSADASLHEASLTRDLDPTVTDADQLTLSLDNARFGLNLWKQVVTDDTSNVVYSPISMSIALSMAYAAASGTTATQMASAMQYTLPPARLFPAIDKLDLALQSRGPAGNVPGVTVNLVQAAWADQRLSIGAGYLNTLALDYGTGVHVLDIADSPDSAAATINDWVATATQQKILNLQPPGSITLLTRLVLVNATYFAGAWQTPFDPQYTSPTPFTRRDGSKVQVPMMQALTSPSASNGHGYVAVELPYAGSQVSMVLVLPDAASFASVEAGLTGDFIVGVFNALAPTSDVLYMPRFSVTSRSIDLATALQALGMVDAFSLSMAEFAPALVDPEGPLHIQHVFHEAFIAVDESGTEAAAATAVDIALDGGVSDVPVPVVTVNRPFFFFLRDIPTNSVLFAGRVMDPTSK